MNLMEGFNMTNLRLSGEIDKDTEDTEKDESCARRLTKAIIRRYDFGGLARLTETVVPRACAVTLSQ